MCGILGTVDRPFGNEVLESLRHRGPDDGSISKRSIGKRTLTLGHRRLSILDLSPAGRQPMWTPCDEFGIVFNGEIYNHVDLRAELDSIPYRGHSDTETTLHYLARRGIGAVDRLNGIFALGFVDQPRNKLYLARDAFGVKPLYYWIDDNSFVFASEISAILKLVDDSLEPQHLAELLKLRYVPSPDTLFKKIRKVRPGHIVEVSLRGHQITATEYSFCQPESTRTCRLSQTEAVEQYGWHLKQAVKRQMLSDVKLGVLLSGGVDSAIVAQIAQANCSYTMPAFTVGFSSPDKSDEIADARDTARAIGLEHHDVRVGFADFVDLLPRVTAIVEEPVATTSILPMFYLSRLASQHVKVVLSGQGADEALGGYRRYQMEVLRSLVPDSAAFAAMSMFSMLGIRNDTARRVLASIGEKDDVRRFEAIYSAFSSAQIESLIGSATSRATARIRYFYDLLECSALQHSVERMMRLDLRMNLADDLLLYTDKVTMHHSIECRVPLLDRELIRFIESLPRRYRLGVLRGKLIHKRFARGVLPASIVRRKKKGFVSPTNRWFRQSTVVRDILLNPNSKFSGFFSRRAVEAILDEHDRGINRERHIFLLLSISSWMDQYLTGQRRETAPAAVSC